MENGLFSVNSGEKKNASQERRNEISSTITSDRIHVEYRTEIEFHAMQWSYGSFIIIIMNEYDCASLCVRAEL